VSLGWLRVWRTASALQPARPAPAARASRLTVDPVDVQRSVLASELALRKPGLQMQRSMP
jgi:hypothetical protein